jgi:hypothetical protein
MQPRMIRVSDIERLQRTMDSAPEHQAEEVTTLQAVGMLSSQIDAMQAKGYGLPAIAQLLSDNGVVVTARTLKTYLGEARAAGGRKTRRKTRARRPVRNGAAATDPTTESTRPVEARTTSGDAAPGARVVTEPYPGGTTSAAPTPATVVPKVTARPGDNASSRRSTFVPTEDTRDI